MTNDVKRAYEWALNQNYQSVAAQYARILAEHISAAHEQEKEMGEWIITDGDSGSYELGIPSWIDVQCSKCRFKTGFEEGEYGWSAQDEGNKIPFAYCPNCGAKMEAPNE
jgi:hypothetical protein